MKCLVIEDDRNTCDYISRSLEQSGHIAQSVYDGIDGLHFSINETWDIVILDRMLPGKVDGLAILKTMRDLGKTTPVLILSALSNVDERVRGLRSGGDDYVTKPFSFSELLARVEILGRRSSISNAQVLASADLTLDTRTMRAVRAGVALNLQPREFRLLEYLMRHEGQVVTRSMLLEGVWDCHFDPQTNVIDVQMSRLRSKLDKGFDIQLIHTVRGMGYRLGGGCS